MPPQFTQNWVPLERIEQSLQFEPALFVLLTAISSFFVYRLVLSDLSTERHRNLRALFKNLLAHCLIAGVLLCSFWIVRAGTLPLAQLLPTLGLATVFWGAIVLVKSFRIFAFEYLFFMNMQTGVPLLLVNMLTLLVSIILGSWIATSVFGFRLAPVLATSALFSIVLGLALQETLGNLFSGIALQVDKPYALGDWIEVQTSNQKLVGQVFEITWRATILVSFSEEWVTIPNRVVAQSQVLNYSKTKKPILKNQVFRFSYDVNIQEVKNMLVGAVRDLKGLSRYSEPIVLVSEVNESWVSLKLVYALKDFGDQFRIADEVLMTCLEVLRKEQVPLAGPRIFVSRDKTA